MLHSSALDEWHSIPTTADITQFASRGAASGARIYPSNGLSTAQIREAIKQTGLEPVLLEGDIATDSWGYVFSHSQFSVSCAALIRSGYPVVLIARAGNDNHAVCMIGCRLDHEREPEPDDGDVVLMDSRIRYVYLHDDNLGPGVRFEVKLNENSAPDCPETHFVELKSSAPDPRAGTDPHPDDPCKTYMVLTPSYLIAAVPGDLRMSPDTLHRTALDIAESVVGVWDEIAPDDEPIVAIRTSFIRLTEYLDVGLRTVLGSRPQVLGAARLALAERVVPMSRILGVVRLGVEGQAIADVLLDTTEGDGHPTPFCTVVFSAQLLRLLRAAFSGGGWGYGTLIDATR